LGRVVGPGRALVDGPAVPPVKVLAIEQRREALWRGRRGGLVRPGLRGNGTSRKAEVQCGDDCRGEGEESSTHGGLLWRVSCIAEGRARRRCRASCSTAYPVALFAASPRGVCRRCRERLQYRNVICVVT